MSTDTTFAALGVPSSLTAVLEQAGRLDPAIVRSLDAIHLAAALMLGDDLEAFVTYYERLAEAARANGVAVVAPT